MSIRIKARTLFSLLATVLVMATGLAGCGGGGSTVAGGGIVGTGDTQVVASGAISAFGSIFVNGTRFDVGGATIRANGVVVSESALKIGMVVSVAGTISATAGARAVTVDYRPSVVGVVEGADVTASALIVQGQRIAVDRGTRIDGADSLAALVGQVAEVSGFMTSAGGLLASRVEAKGPPAAQVRVSVDGTVSALDAAARTFWLGTQRVDYSALGAAAVPATLANGAAVTVVGLTTGSGAVVVAESINLTPPVVASTEASEVEIEGLVSAFVSNADFRVSGQRVDARNATYSNGTAADLANDRKVEVEGVLAGGIVVARKVEFKSVPMLTLKGVVESVDAAAQTLGVAGERVVVNTATAFEDKSAAAVRNFSLADIRVGDRIEVRGVRDSRGIVASQVTRETTVTPGSPVPVKVQGTIAAFVSIADFTVGGQRVDASRASVSGGNASDLVNGAVVEVEGPISSGVLRATKLDIRSLPSPNPNPGPSPVRIEGVISGFVSIANFRVGSQLVNAAQASISGGNAADLADGRAVAVEGPIVNAVLQATRVEIQTSPPSGNPAVKLEGPISGFVSASQFVVAGQTVNASGATFEGGTAADLANGRLVEVTGTPVSGVIVATRVEFKATPPAPDPTIEVEGLVSQFASLGSFRVAGQLVDGRTATITGGVAADIANGRNVNARGPVRAGVLVATAIEIKPEDDDGPTSVEVEGLVANFVSIANFSVAGRQVDASAASFRNGTSADVVNGRKVNVRGTLSGNVLRANRVDLK